MLTPQNAGWWHGILARSLSAVVGIALLLGGGSILLVGKSVGEREHAMAEQRLAELLDAVESTASIAGFAGDEQLATEVVQGLMRNGDVRRVSIHAGGHILAQAERATQDALPVLARLTATRVPRDHQIVRELKSPFKASDVVGTIELEANWGVIEERVLALRKDTVYLLAWQLLLVVAAVAAMMLFLVIRPIKGISDRLHRLDPTSGTLLGVPEGHDRTEIGRLVGDINDLTGRLVATLQQERSLQQQQAIAQRKYQDLFEHAASGIFVADGNGRIESFNRAFAELTWLPMHAESGDRRLDEANWQDAQRLVALLRASLDKREGSTEDDFLLIGPRGDQRWLHVAAIPVGDGNLQGTVTDVTQRKLEELSARRQAVIDSLTGFANRAGLLKLVDDLRLRAETFALVMIDLDGFKQINDAMGFPVGDQLLVMVSARLRIFLEDGEEAARIGGDEFVLLLDETAGRSRFDARIEKLLNLLGQPYLLAVQEGGSQEIALGASIGVSTFPTDGKDIHQLLRCAELALGSVRQAGGHDYRYFDPQLLAAVEDRRRLEDDLRHALGARELQLAFQAIIDLASGRLAGAEALLRWSHPVRGMVSPELFIPLAEEMGLIGDIGRMVLEEASAQVAAWRASGLDMYVSVNVSARQIPEELPPAMVINQLKKHGLPPEAVVIEITEGVLMTNVATAQTWIESLRAAGLRIYLDDFGTGYSSLSYLKRFPLDTVKIDKSFIREMGENSSDRTLVDAIIKMAHSLGLNVVAEGVETAAQLEILRELGCGFGQGYLYSRPVAAPLFPAVAAAIHGALPG